MSLKSYLNFDNNAVPIYFWEKYLLFFVPVIKESLLSHDINQNIAKFGRGNIPVDGNPQYSQHHLTHVCVLATNTAYG